MIAARSASRSSLFTVNFDYAFQKHSSLLQSCTIVWRSLAHRFGRHSKPASCRPTLLTGRRSFQRCLLNTAASRAAPVREAVISVPIRSRKHRR